MIVQNIIGADTLTNTSTWVLCDILLYHRSQYSTPAHILNGFRKCLFSIWFLFFFFFCEFSLALTFSFWIHHYFFVPYRLTHLLIVTNNNNAGFPKGEHVGQRGKGEMRGGSAKFRSFEGMRAWANTWEEYRGLPRGDSLGGYSWPWGWRVENW